MHKTLARLRARLGEPRIPRVAAAVAAVLLVPSLFTGLALDDYVHRLRAVGALPVGSRLDLFTFCDAQTKSLGRAMGLIPWFAHPALHLAFLRPLTSLTHFVDYNVWPGAPWLMHAENLVVYAALVYVAARLYFRMLGAGWVAGLASVAYALDPGHGFAGWIAGRNGVLAPALALAGLLAHDRFRRDGWRVGRIAGPMLYALGLLAGEAALGALGYFAAYELVLERGPRSKRAAAFAPYLAVAVLWQLAYRGLGYGAFGGGFYVDPGRQPLHFLAVAPARAVALLAGLLGPPVPEVYGFLRTDGLRVLVASGALFLVLVGWLFARLVAEDRTCRFFLVGAVLAVVPACATFPAGRLLFLVSFGATGLIARWLGSLGAPTAPAKRATERGLAFVWLLFHGVLAPVLFEAESVSAWAIGAFAERSGSSLPRPGELADRTTVVVNSPDLVLSAYRFFIPWDGSLARAGRGRLLSVTGARARVSRTAADAIALRAEDGLLAEASAWLVRDESFPLRAGERIDDDGLGVRVEKVDEEGHPTSALFTFDKPLDDASFFWIAWDGARFVPFTPPPVGSEVDVGAP